MTGSQVLARACRQRAGACKDRSSTLVSIPPSDWSCTEGAEVQVQWSKATAYKNNPEHVRQQCCCYNVTPILLHMSRTRAGDVTQSTRKGCLWPVLLPVPAKSRRTLPQWSRRPAQRPWPLSWSTGTPGPASPRSSESVDNKHGFIHPEKKCSE